MVRPIDPTPQHSPRNAALSRNALYQLESGADKARGAFKRVPETSLLLPRTINRERFSQILTGCKNTAKKANEAAGRLLGLPAA
jgi:hypothetical protein